MEYSRIEAKEYEALSARNQGEKRKILYLNRVLLKEMHSMK